MTVQRLPWVTIGIIAMNFVVFAFTWPTAQRDETRRADAWEDLITNADTYPGVWEEDCTRCPGRAEFDTLRERFEAVASEHIFLDTATSRESRPSAACSARYFFTRAGRTCCGTCTVYGSTDAASKIFGGAHSTASSISRAAWPPRSRRAPMRPTRSARSGAPRGRSRPLPASFSYAAGTPASDFSGCSLFFSERFRHPPGSGSVFGLPRSSSTPSSMRTSRRWLFGLISAASCSARS